MTTLRAEERLLSCWSGSGAAYGRFDYRHEDHRLQDMLNNDYFGNCPLLLKRGDFITIIDCEDQIMTVRVDFVDRRALKCHLSRIERLYALPVVMQSDDPDDPGLTWSWRARNGGGHSIINAKGEIVAINFASKETAEQAIAVMYEKKIYSAPTGHEPTKQFVKHAPIAKGA
jgi:hypothetical protein